MTDKPCPFCSLDDREIVLQAEHAVAFYDGFPVNPGHMLIIPRRHEPSFFELTPEERTDILELLDRAEALLTEKHSPAGFNIGINIGRAAGQTVFHAHVHLIPRYEGDVARPQGGIRGVIPDRQAY
ncbi:HIT family protein [bacterium]|nr:HIT family protein [bacterium]